jgi:hypothetical protein
MLVASEEPLVFRLRCALSDITLVLITCAMGLFLVDVGSGLFGPAPGQGRGRSSRCCRCWNH